MGNDFRELKLANLTLFIWFVLLEFTECHEAGV